MLCGKKTVSIEKLIIAYTDPELVTYLCFEPDESSLHTESLKLTSSERHRPPRLKNKTLYEFIISPMRAAYPAPLVFLDLAILKIFLLCSSSSLLGTSIPIITVFSTSRVIYLRRRTKFHTRTNMFQTGAQKTNGSVMCGNKHS